MKQNSEMSLTGFNSNRRIPYSNLTGSVGSNVMLTPVMLRSRMVANAPPNAMRKVTSSVPKKIPVTKKANVDENVRVIVKKDPVNREAVASGKGREVRANAEVHWTYGTAMADVFECGTTEKVASSGERILLVFPMKEDKGGVVRMRCKKIDPSTATMSYH